MPHTTAELPTGAEPDSIEALRRSRAIRCVCALVGLWAGQGAWAADGYGEISGTVYEAAGDPAPLAHVTVMNSGGGIQRDLLADLQGKYRIPHLPPGSYTVTARSARGNASGSITAEIGDGASPDLRLTLSPAWALLESDGLWAIPLDGASYLGALYRASEATPGEEGGNIEGYTPYAPRGNSSFNSLGQRGQDNNFLLDGIDNNDAWLRGAVLMPPVEAISSLSLDAVYIPASVGHATGGSVAVETRSGSDQFHGGVFDYLQNSGLDARNFFDGAGKPELVRNQFGGSLGGPVRGPGWFFFADAEVLRERQGLTVISTVPTGAQKAGDFGATPVFDPLSIGQVGAAVLVRQQFTGNQIPVVRIPQPARNLMALYPNPNLPGIADNYRFTPAQVENSSRLGGRTDKIFSSRSTLFARFNYERTAEQSPGAFPAPANLVALAGPYVGSDSVQHADDADTRVTAWGGGVSHTFVVRPGWINELRAGVTRLDLCSSVNGGGSDASAALGIPGLSAAGLPTIDPEGFTQLGAAEPVPMHVRSTTYQIEDMVSWKTARHEWTFGFQVIRRHVDGDASEWTSRGSFLFTPDYTGLPGVGLTGDSVASLLTGYPTEVRRDVQFAPFALRGWEAAGFAQDEIRIGRNLRIQAGLRYSLDPPVTEASNRLVNFNYGRLDPALNQFAGQGGVNAYGGLSFNRLTMAPRVGIAWDIFGSGATVLRGGFSKDYDTGSYIAEGVLAQNPPYASRLDMINGTFQVGPNLTAGLPAAQSQMLLNAAALNAANGSIYAIEPRSYTPYADQWGLFLQQRVRPGLTVEAAGMGSMGIHLYETYDANQAYPAPSPYNYPRYPYTNYDSRLEYLGFAGGSTYYGGQLKVAGQAARGLRILATYRFAKSLDDSTVPGSSQDSRPPVPQFSYNLRGNRSPSPFDVTHRVVLTASYDLPFRSAAGQRSVNSRVVRALISDWTSSAVVTVQSGFPFTPQLAVNSLNNGGIQLPDRVTNGALPSSERSYLQWFNTSLSPADPNRAFAVPVVFQYGNSGFDILRGPGLASADLALDRAFPLSERLRLRTRVEGLNALNRTNLALPNRILGVESAGAISHTSTTARQIEAAVRVEF